MFHGDSAEKFRKRLVLTAKGREGARDMGREEAREALAFLFTAEAHPAQVGAFLTAMRFKSATPDEMLGFLDAMEATATRIAPEVTGLINCNGPYDGRKRSLNLAVAAAIVASAAGVPVVLHSTTGLPPKDGVTNAKLLDALGFPAAKEPDQVRRDIECLGFGHLHAARYLHGVERLKPIRQVMHFRTLLHTCEVMLNPAGAQRSLLGAAHAHFLERFARVAAQRGQTHVIVVQGLDGGDELPLAPTHVVEYRADKLEQYILAPTDLGLKEAPAMRCETPLETARRTQAILAGKDEAGLDAVLFNAALRIYLGGKADSVAAGLCVARATIDSGKAASKLETLRGQAV